VRDAYAVVVARDGTMYFGQPGAIGRRLPDGTLDAHWVVLDEPLTPRQLVLGAENETLFGALASETAPLQTPRWFRVDVTAAHVTLDEERPSATVLTMSPEGLLYYSDGGFVVHVDPAGGPVTESVPFPQDSPTGLGFDVDGRLLVATRSGVNGYVYRIGLDANGVQTTRDVPIMTHGAAGVRVDASGRIYVTLTAEHLAANNGMLRFDPGAQGGVAIDIGGSMDGATTSLDFGHGALCPTDLFVANDRIVRIATDTAGAAVPWH
jgi:sugar lactone lactonase YvrE